MGAAPDIMRTIQICLSVFAVCLSCMSVHAGYTHYFTWNQKPSDADLKACVSEMRLVIEARKDILVGPDGPASAMIFDSTHVDLNGIGDDANEPFIFPGESGFNFCKTEGKPYDAVVTACLLVARDHFPSAVLLIGSDGSWDAGDWQDGAKLYSSVLSRPAQNPIDGSGLGNTPPPVGMEHKNDSHIRLWILLAAVLVLVAVFSLSKLRS